MLQGGWGERRETGQKEKDGAGGEARSAFPRALSIFRLLLFLL